MRLSEGCKMEQETETVQKEGRPKYELEDLIAEMPDGLPLVEGWDEMQPVGLEVLSK